MKRTRVNESVIASCTRGTSLWFFMFLFKFIYVNTIIHALLYKIYFIEYLQHDGYCINLTIFDISKTSFPIRIMPDQQCHTPNLHQI
jgi:hypothetical protein